MLIGNHGVDLDINDRITFTTKHRYDIKSYVGTFCGLVPYAAAKVFYPNVATYYQNLDFTLIQNPNKYDVLNYLLLTDDNGARFAVAPEWIREGSLKKVSNQYKDVRIIGVDDEEAFNALLQTIRDQGYTVELK